MGLSTNNFVHYTRTLDSLKGILQGHFRVNYCRESLQIGPDAEVFRIPMVSFCEIPLSQVKDHIQKYGSYGIGLTREWVIRNRLNPVFYIEPNSNIANSYSAGIEYFHNRLHNTSDPVEQDIFGNNLNLILDFLRYTKLYEGPLVRKGYSTDRYRFSEEREWRYVPPPDKSVKGMYFDDDFDNPIVRRLALKDVEAYKLEFFPSDVRSIIVSSDDEISEIIDFIRNNYSKSSRGEIDLLISRIITKKQIEEDF